MKPSSVIAITRGSGSELEVFWSQRQHAMQFLGGFWAFAGGSVEPADIDVPVAGQIPDRFEDSSFFAAAAREIFEEMGLWVTERGIRHVSHDPELAALRADLDGAADFAAALRARSESVDASRFHASGKWKTPEWFDLQFDSEFFALALTQEENDLFGDALADHLLERELIRGEWIFPEQALSRWRSAERYITLPIRRHLEGFLQAQGVEEVRVNSADVAFHYREWLIVPGIYVFPLLSPTIPPATHTNCIVVGEDRFVVVDPGSPYDREQEQIGALVAQMVDEGRIFEAIVLTHHHPDHIGGVDDLRRRFDVPVWAHRRTAEQVDFEVQRELGHTDVIDLGEDSLECLFTPGHAAGHLCFHHARTDAVIVGDLIASVGTILVNPPDGHMGDYLESLALVRDLAPRAVYPAHGWMVTNPVQRLQFYIDHRLAREDKVLAALQRYGKAATAADIVPDAYSDAPRAVWPIAARSAEAHLVHLEELGRVTRKGTRWTFDPA